MSQRKPYRRVRPEDPGFGSEAARVLRERVLKYQSIHIAIGDMIDEDRTKVAWSVILDFFDPTKEPYTRWSCVGVNHAYVDITNVVFETTWHDPWNPLEIEKVWGALPAGLVLDQVEREEDEGSSSTG